MPVPTPVRTSMQKTSAISQIVSAVHALMESSNATEAVWRLVVSNCSIFIIIIVISIILAVVVVGLYKKYPTIIFFSNLPEFIFG